MNIYISETRMNMLHNLVYVHIPV